MNIDCLRKIFLYCNVNNILQFKCVNKKFKNIIDDDGFWKLMMLRDFNDINKSLNEKWIDYYKRRMIDYGIPILINNDIHQYNRVKQFISIKNKNNTQNLILTKDNEVYLVHSDGFTKINHGCKIKQIYGTENFYFVDITNCLYQIISDKRLILLKSNVDKVIIDHKSMIYYTDNNKINLTHYINGHISQRIFDFKFLDLINLERIDYIIDNDNNLKIGKMVNKKYEIENYGIKAIQLSQINNKILIILRMDGFVILCKNGKFRVIKISHVQMLGYNSFLTKNGNLYYFDKTYNPILIDTDVTYVNYVTDDGENGCYVKRSII